MVTNNVVHLRTSAPQLQVVLGVFWSVRVRVHACIFVCRTLRPLGLLRSGVLGEWQLLFEDGGMGGYAATRWQNTHQTAVSVRLGSCRCQDLTVVVKKKSQGKAGQGRLLRG